MLADIVDEFERLPQGEASVEQAEAVIAQHQPELAPIVDRHEAQLADLRQQVMDLRNEFEKSTSEERTSVVGALALLIAYLALSAAALGQVAKGDYVGMVTTLIFILLDASNR